MATFCNLFWTQTGFTMLFPPPVFATAKLLQLTGLAGMCRRNMSCQRPEHLPHDYGALKVCIQAQQQISPLLK